MSISINRKLEIIEVINKNNKKAAAVQRKLIDIAEEFGIK